MYKLFVFASVICFASAGLIGHHGLGSVAVAHAPVAVAHAPVAVAHTAHVAQSYANNHLISVHPVPVQVAHSAPLIHAAPAIAHAAPVLPIAAHGYSFGHGAGLHGYH